MESTMKTGRVVGSLLLLHLVLGLMTPFILLDRVRGSAGFLANAAGSATLFRVALLLLIGGSAMAVAASVAGAPVLGRHSRSTASALLALAAAAFCLQVVDTAFLMSILALSQQHAMAVGASGDLDRTLAVVVGAGRRWVHYSYLLVAVSWILLLSAALSRFRLAPRILTALLAAACLSQLAGVSIPGLLGASPVTALAIPMAPAYLALAGWLLKSGFANRPSDS